MTFVSYAADDVVDDPRGGGRRSSSIPDLCSEAAARGSTEIRVFDTTDLSSNQQLNELPWKGKAYRAVLAIASRSYAERN
jgi:hypothetical protein